MAKNFKVKDIVSLFTSGYIQIDCMLGNDPEIDFGSYTLFKGLKNDIQNKYLAFQVDSWEIRNDTFILLIPKKELSEQECKNLLQNG